MSFYDIPLYIVMLVVAVLLVLICLRPAKPGMYTQVSRNIEVGEWKRGFQCDDCCKAWFHDHNPLDPCPYCGGIIDDLFQGRYVRYNGDEYIQSYNLQPDNIITDVAVGHFAADGAPLCPPVRLKRLLRCTNGIGVPRNVLRRDTQTS